MIISTIQENAVICEKICVKIFANRDIQRYLCVIHKAVRAILPRTDVWGVWFYRLFLFDIKKNTE